MAEPVLNPETISVKQFVDEYTSGRISIPEFQRDYVWPKRRAPILVDSLYRKFPISSLLIWESDEPVHARRKSPRPANSPKGNWLIDGQQRLLTLYQTMSGEESIDVVFNPEEDRFQLANVATRKDPNWFHVSQLWDDEQYHRISRNLDPGRSDERRRLERFAKVREVLQYGIPLVRMVNHTFADAVLVFTRINTQGFKLKTEDIESARIAATHTKFIAEDVAPFLAKMKRDGFTRLNVMHLFRACDFIANPDARSRTPLYRLQRQEVLSAWKRTEQATHAAIDVIKSELGLINMEILWSGALIVPLIALCATQPIRERNAREMVGWLALASLLHRYSRSSETALDQDLRACRQSDPIGALLSQLRESRSELRARPSDFAGSLNDRSGLLAAYIACRHRGMRDLFTEQKINLQKSIDRHHLLARQQFPEKEQPRSDNVGNIAFLVSPVNKSLSSTGPEVYLPGIKSAIRESQCIPLDESLYRIKRADEFWEARRALLAESFNEFVSAALPKRRGVGE